MELIIERPSSRKSLVFSGTLAMLLAQEGINPESVLAVRNGELITCEDAIQDDDTIKVLSVISGG